MLVWDRECSQSKDKWRKLHGPLRQWCAGEYHYTEVCEGHSLQVGPITDLMGSKVAWVGLGNAYTRLLGYVVIWVQVDGVWGYDEDQIALIIPDYSNFTTEYPSSWEPPPLAELLT